MFCVYVSCGRVLSHSSFNIPQHLLILFVYWAVISQKNKVFSFLKKFSFQIYFRNLVQLYKNEDDTEISKKIKTQWTSLGLEDVQFVNYSVLLNLPGPSPSTVTLSSSGQCFHPNGQPCSEEARKDSSQDLLYSYAAYSAKGTLKVIWPFVSVIYSEWNQKITAFI